MRHAWLTVAIALLLMIPHAMGQEPSGDKKGAALEKTLEDVNNQWLCAYQYYKPKAQDCVNFRAQYWADRFFEIYPNGQIQTKAEMVASQTENASKHPDTARGEGPNPQEFKLMAVYGDLALATDHTIFKAAGTGGQLSVTGEARVLRIFVRENGKWRPAAAALVGIEKPK
jgi:hypothetical protein